MGRKHLQQLGNYESYALLNSRNISIFCCFFFHIGKYIIVALIIDFSALLEDLTRELENDPEKKDAKCSFAMHLFTAYWQYQQYSANIKNPSDGESFSCFLFRYLSFLPHQLILSFHFLSF